MQQTFQHILDLTIKHAYFKDGNFKSIQISTAGDTPNLLRDLGIIIKSFSGGIHLLANDPELLNANEKDFHPIRLYLFCHDPYYINYSELPDYRPSDTVLYFNNLDSTPNSEDTGLLLHKKDHVNQNDVAQLSFGRFAVNNFKSINTYHFEDIFGIDVSDNISQSQENSNEFLISNLPQGIVKVFANGQEKERVYYYPKSVWKKPLGIVELYVSQLFEQFDKNGSQAYTMNFNTIETKWKYILVDPVYQKFRNLSIINGKKESVFGLSPDGLHEADAHRVFQSVNQIPLLEYSEDIYTLVNDDNSTPIIKALPSASPEQLFYDDDMNRESHIYI